MILPRKLRVMIDPRREVIVGIADARLAQVGIGDLLRTVGDSLPEGLAPEQVRVGSFQETGSLVILRLFAPSIRFEARPGDFINAGVALYYSVTGNAIQVFGYTRRAADRSEAIGHVCSGGKKPVSVALSPPGRLERCGG